MRSLELSPITCLDGGGQCLVPPVVTRDPSDMVVTNGGHGGAGGGGGGDRAAVLPMVFQCDDGGGGSANGTLVLSPVEPGEAGSYAVVVSNAYGSVTSAVARVVVIGPPTLIGWFRVGDGPAWGTARPCYSAREAAALLFGGALCEYADLNRPKQFESHGLGGWLGGYNLPEHPRAFQGTSRTACYIPTREVTLLTWAITFTSARTRLITCGVPSPP